MGKSMYRTINYPNNQMVPDTKAGKQGRIQLRKYRKNCKKQRHHRLLPKINKKNINNI